MVSNPSGALPLDLEIDYGIAVVARETWETVPTLSPGPDPTHAVLAKQLPDFIRPRL
ncbi:MULTISPECIES: hypothetical protein [unclassified Mycobacterium]|uniref:hypothetical protein n=1 Tax=unclassified Mycobacterium TaxID=2642494 RepID=UPI000B2E1EC1|nr:MULTISPECIES: hypothetical protein [unclassified Mycobacterium]